MRVLLVLGALLAAEALWRLDEALGSLETFTGYARRPPVPAELADELRPRFVALAFGWGIYPLLCAAAGLFAAVAAVRRWAGWPLTLALAAGIYAGVGFDGLYFNAESDVRMLFSRHANMHLRSAVDLSRNLFVAGTSTYVFFAVPWPVRLGGSGEAKAPKHPSLFWSSFLGGLFLTLVVAELSRRVSDSMGRW